MRNKLGLLILIFVILAGSCKKEEPESPAEESARFSVWDVNGNKLDSGVEFTFHTTDASANLPLLIKNETQEQIGIRTKLVEVNGTDGSEFEVCIGNCYPGMQLNTAYPLNGSYPVAAGATTDPNEIHYQNHYAGSCYYVVEIYETDASGNKKGDAFRFKYIHN